MTRPYMGRVIFLLYNSLILLFYIVDSAFLIPVLLWVHVHRITAGDNGKRLQPIRDIQHLPHFIHALSYGRNAEPYCPQPKRIRLQQKIFHRRAEINLCVVRSKTFFPPACDKGQRRSFRTSSKRTCL